MRLMLDLRALDQPLRAGERGGVLDGAQRRLRAIDRDQDSHARDPVAISA